MRIVAGMFRGRPLVAPKGQLTRPTSDRVRQALFDVLEHAPWSRGLGGLRVVDLFAGSGALGLEALSRGAASCLFVDSDPAAALAISGNIQSLGLADRARVQRAATSLLADRPFDLAFLDPPYAQGLCEQALAFLASGGRLAAGAVAVVEQGSGEAALAAPGYAILDTRAWGAARVSFLTLNEIIADRTAARCR
jgi:16S rRNA (guanine966-N2)-methyltransferase